MGDKLLKALIGLLAGAAGIVIGALVRQPEINDLQKQVKLLQKKAAHLQQVAREQNEEVAELTLKYQALRFYQFFQKSEMKVQLQESLSFQYATADYLHLLMDHLDRGEKIEDESTADFYYAFSLLLSGKKLSDEQKVDIRSYVKKNHAYEIEGLIPCKLESVLEEFAAYGKGSPDDEGFFKLPKIELPKLPDFFKKDEDNGESCDEAENQPSDE